MLSSLLILEVAIAWRLRSRPLWLHRRARHTIVRSFGRYDGAGLKGLIREAGRGASIAVLKALRELVDVEVVRAAEVAVHRGRVEMALGALWKHAVRVAVRPLVHSRRSGLGGLQAATWSATPSRRRNAAMVANREAVTEQVK